MRGEGPEAKRERSNAQKSVNFCDLCVKKRKRTLRERRFHTDECFRSHAEDADFRRGIHRYRLYVAVRLKTLGKADKRERSDALSARFAFPFGQRPKGCEIRVRQNQRVGDIVES